MPTVFCGAFALIFAANPESLETKKADVAEHPKVFDHVGLLLNKPPGKTG
jgi:hypothetical protein